MTQMYDDVNKHVISAFSYREYTLSPFAFIRSLIPPWRLLQHLSRHHIIDEKRKDAANSKKDEDSTRKREREEGKAWHTTIDAQQSHLKCARSNRVRTTTGTIRCWLSRDISRRTTKKTFRNSTSYPCECSCSSNRTRCERECAARLIVCIGL